MPSTACCGPCKWAPFFRRALCKIALVRPGHLKLWGALLLSNICTLSPRWPYSARSARAVAAAIPQHGRRSGGRCWAPFGPELGHSQLPWMWYDARCCVLVPDANRHRFATFVPQHRRLAMGRKSGPALAAGMPNQGRIYPYRLRRARAPSAALLALHRPVCVGLGIRLLVFQPRLAAPARVFITLFTPSYSRPGCYFPFHRFTIARIADMPPTDMPGCSITLLARRRLVLQGRQELFIRYTASCLLGPSCAERPVSGIRNIHTLAMLESKTRGNA
ncbi:hypothetical protein C8R47DRAFT_1062873 [Mycena vitilis]|nr:hypothetical protein C8R47DRAFT_1062873 [Mycena vitilis]